MKEELPRATHAGELKIGDITIPCAVLEDGRRVLTQQGFLQALGRARAAKGGTGASVTTVDKMPAFLVASNLKPFISDELIASTKPIVFRTVKGHKAFGYNAELLPKVCKVYLDARDAGALVRTQYAIAAKCDILTRGMATVGVVALVDEATGYQHVRARRALEEILDKFICDELGKWAKTFPDEFYKEMFRLRGWSYDPKSVKRPSVIGRYTLDLVYKRLAPGVLEELKRKEPQKKHRYFQWLTEDVGHPKLREHLAAVIALMKASSTWNRFYGSMQRALPKYGETIHMFPELFGGGDDGED